MTDSKEEECDHSWKFDRNEGGFSVLKCSKCSREQKVIA